MERDNRTILESARTMIHSKRMYYKFWAEAVNLAVHVLNRTGTSTVPEKSPYELWFDKNTIFGSEVFLHIPKEKRRKLDPKVGYDNHTKSYRVWNPEVKRIEIARDVNFLLEKFLATLDIGDSLKADGEGASVSDGELDTVGAEGVSEQRIERGAICDVNVNNVIENRLRDRSNIKTGRRLSCFSSAEQVAMLTVSEEPTTYKLSRQLNRMITSSGS